MRQMLFANKLKQLREEKQLLQKQIASVLEIDTPMYSRIERGKRKAKRKQVILIAQYLDVNKEELLKLWVADRVYAILEEETATKIISFVAEDVLTYSKCKNESIILWRGNRK